MSSQSIKRRNRNFGPDLRVLSSRSASQRKRSLSPVVKCPGITYSHSFTEVSITDDETDSEEGSFKSVATFDSKFFFERKLNLSKDRKSAGRVHDESGSIRSGFQGSVDGLLNHPLLKKDRNTISDARCVTFALPNIRQDKKCSRETITPVEMKVNQKQKKIGSGLMGAFSRKKKIGKGENELPSAADLLKSTSTDAEEIAYILKCSSDQSASKFAHVQATLDAQKTRGVHASGLKKTPAKPVDELILQQMKTLIAKGDMHARQDHFENAMRYYMKAIEIFDKGNELPDDHPLVHQAIEKLRSNHHKYKSIQDAERILMMGQEQEILGRYIRACKFYTVAYRIQMTTLGKHHPALVKPLNLLGALMGRRGQYDDSLKFLTMALDLQTSPNERAVTERNIGAVYEQMGNYNKALELYHVSLQLHRKNRGDSESIVYTGARSKSRAREVFVEEPPLRFCDGILRSGADGVEVFLETSAEMYNVPLPGKSPSSMEEMEALVEVALTLHSVGRILARHFGHYSLGMIAYMNSLTWMKLALGLHHPNVAAILGNIGNLCREAGDYERAHMIYQEVLRIERMHFGNSHAEIAVTMHNIGTIYYGKREYREALSCFQKAVKIQKQAFGLDSALVSISSASMAEVCEKMNDVQQALIAYKIAMEIDMMTMGKTHPDVGVLKQRMGMLLFRMTNEHDEAEKYFIEALEIYKANKYTDNHPNVREVVRNLADIKGKKSLTRCSSGKKR